MPTNDAKVVLKFLKKHIFTWFRTPRAIISYGGKHFINQLVRNILVKDGVYHKMATTYHPQINGQVKVSNREVKQILHKIVNAQRNDWAMQLDDALWVYMIVSTPIGTSPYHLVFGKACYLLVELEHQAYWKLKKMNLDPQLAGRKHMVQLHELEEFRLHAYENSKLYKLKTKRWHDKHIKSQIFEPVQKVLLFNSRLCLFPGKLKSKWSGPFQVVRMTNHGAVELQRGVNSVIG